MTGKHDVVFQLIEAVKDRPIIYDRNQPDYRKIAIREKAWEEVAKIVRKNVDFTKKKWKGLRDTFVMHRRRLVEVELTRSEGVPVAPTPVTWMYYDSLTFLFPFTESQCYSRSSHLEYNGHDMDNSSIHDATDSDGQDDLITRLSKRRKHNHDEDPLDADTIGDDDDDRSKRQTAENTETRLHRAVERLCSASEDPMKLFFQSFALQAKSLSEANQSILQMRCMEILHEMRFDRSEIKPE